MKQFYTAASTLLALSMTMMTACSSDSDPVIDEQPIVPEQPAVGTRTITLKASAELGDETRVSVEDVDGKEDAFRITGWNNGDVVTVLATKSGQYYEFPFTYNVSKGEFTSEVQDDFLDNGGKFVYAYVGGKLNRENNLDPGQVVISLPIAISNPEDCFLFGNVNVDEDRWELSAVLTAPYALACVHNNTDRDIEVCQIDNYGEYFEGDIEYENLSSSQNDVFVFSRPTELYAESAQTHTIAANSKAYFVIPPKFDEGDDYFIYYGLYDFSHSKIIAEPKENIILGKVYKVQVSINPMAWEYPLQLADWKTSTITFETGIDVSSYQEDEGHHPLNETGKLWEVSDGSNSIKIQTSASKIIAPTDCSDLFRDFSVTQISGLEHLDVSGVTNMSGMFSACSDLEVLDLSSWNTSNVEDMSNMFYDCSALRTLNISSFNTAKVTDMSGMFAGCGSLTSLTFPSSFKTDNAENIAAMFSGCANLNELNLSSFNTANVTNMVGLFSGCAKLTSLTLPSSFTTDKVEMMALMFDGCKLLTNFDFVSKFKTEKVRNFSSMFKDCASLTELDLSHFVISNDVVQMDAVFSGCLVLKKLTLNEDFWPGIGFFGDNCGLNAADGWLTVYGTSEEFRESVIKYSDTGWDSSRMKFPEGVPPVLTKSQLSTFGWIVSSISFETSVDVSSYEPSMDCTILDANGTLWAVTTDNKLKIQTPASKIIAPTDCSDYFKDFNSLTEISGLEHLDVGGVSNMSGMFSGCSALVELDLASWDTRYEKDMSSMFSGCSVLKKITLNKDFLPGTSMFGNGCGSNAAGDWLTVYGTSEQFRKAVEEAPSSYGWDSSRMKFAEDE